MDGLICASCSKVYKTRTCLIRHLKRFKCSAIIENSQARLKCPKCERKFKSYAGRDYHVKKVHNFVDRVPKEKSKKCAKCSAAFVHQSGLSRHTAKHHPVLRAQKLFECFYCHKFFASKDYRLKHEINCKSRANTESSHETTVTSCSLSVTCASSHTQRTCTSTLQTLVNADDLVDGVTSTESSQYSNGVQTIEDVAIIKDVPESSSSYCVTPPLQLYLRDRKPLTQLGASYVETPQRSRINLCYGQETVLHYKKKIRILQQQVRRLKKRVKKYKDITDYLKRTVLTSENDTELISVYLVSPNTN